MVGMSARPHAQDASARFPETTSTKCETADDDVSLKIFNSTSPNPARTPMVLDARGTKRNDRANAHKRAAKG